MAFDEARGVTVLFGGFDGTNALGDLWEFDGTTWTQRFPPDGGPSPRSEASMAWDGVNRGVVLYGGEAGGTVFGGTWVWNGQAWSLKTLPDGGAPVPPTMPGLWGHRLVWDPSRQHVVLVGGSTGSGSRHGTIYEWDGTVWRLAAQQMPTNVTRTLVQAAWDSASQLVSVYGGIGGAFLSSGELGDWWSRSSTGWEALPTGSASIPAGPRASGAMVFDSHRRRFVIFGGSLSAQGGETWEPFTRLFPIDAPSPRQDLAMVYDPIRKQVILFGGLGLNGTNAQALGDTWTFGPR